MRCGWAISRPCHFLISPPQQQQKDRSTELSVLAFCRLVLQALNKLQHAMQSFFCVSSLALLACPIPLCPRSPLYRDGPLGRLQVSWVRVECRSHRRRGVHPPARTSRGFTCSHSWDVRRVLPPPPAWRLALAARPFHRQLNPQNGRRLMPGCASRGLTRERKQTFGLIDRLTIVKAPSAPRECGSFSGLLHTP